MEQSGFKENPEAAQFASQRLHRGLGVGSREKTRESATQGTSLLL